MHDRDLEHPDVTSAQRTGWPSYCARGGAAKCAECEAAVVPGDSEHGMLLEYDGRMLCRECFMEAVEDDMRQDPVAFAQSLLLTVERY